MPELIRDPVCGMDIGADEAVASVVADQRRFYFCCLRCQAAFMDTPHRYVGWAWEPIHRLPAPVPDTRSNLEPCHFAS